MSRPLDLADVAEIAGLPDVAQRIRDDPTMEHGRAMYREGWFQAGRRGSMLVFVSTAGAYIIGILEERGILPDWVVWVFLAPIWWIAYKLPAGGAR